MVITVFFIDDTLVVRHIAIRFMRVMFPHVAERLPQYVSGALHKMDLPER